ncbi:MAG: cation-translocating P-type ATPase [Phototrophicaceae bacterium]|jgi:Ca2+-transporting ATPase
MAANLTESKPNTAWYTLTPDAATKQLSVQPTTGLDDAEAARRLEQYGPNEIADKGAKSPWAILWEQLTQPLVLILIGAAVISALLGKVPELIAILSIVVINAILGVVQEYRAEQAMQALKNMSAPIVRVRRNGKLVDTESRKLVPGDIVLLETGNIVPADLRLIEAANFKVQESSLTGEAESVEKHTESLKDANITLGDRKNMVYMGTSATYGRATGVVVQTGMTTELGRIATLIQNVDSGDTPLQRRMGEVSNVMFWVSILLAFVAIGVGFLDYYLQGVDILGNFREIGTNVLLNAVSIAVAVVPEGLPAVVTVSLALATQRMLARRALIRKLPASETLGSVTVICTDKTGTLTENRMTVKMMDVPGQVFDLSDVMQTRLAKGQHLALANPMEGLLLVAGTMANDSTVERIDRDDKDYIVQGDPTETAISLAAARFGFVKHEMEQVMPRIGEVPFSSERKLMSTIHDKRGNLTADNAYDDVIDKILAGHRYFLFTKGAPDNLLNVCTSVWDNGQSFPMTPQYRQQLEGENASLAGQGLRVLGVAYRSIDALPTDNKWDPLESNLTFIGLVGIIDPPRPEVKAAVEIAHQAGIRVVMITGDHPITARAIARDLNIVDSDTARAMIGTELEKTTDEQLREVVKEVSVYARVSPEHKLRIVRALKANGEIVAMTGDGVNDAPALKQADIGVAMAITGTDVSKEAADMVILDDNFATIVSAAEEGRTIYDNVRRFIKYLLASNTGELFLLLVTQALPGIPLPMNTLQILWMNLITDGIPALALGVEQPEANSMKRPPYAPNESVFGRGLGRHILIVGSVLGFTALGLALITFNLNLQAANSPCMEGASIWSLGDVACPAPLEGEPNFAAWNTMVFIVLTLSQMGHAYALRSHRESVFRLNPLTNRFLLFALVITIIVQVGIIYIPLFQDLFSITPLTLGQLLLCLVLSTGVFIAVEIEKLLLRRGVLKSG